MVQTTNADMFGNVFLIIIGMYVLYHFYVNYYCIPARMGTLAPTDPLGKLAMSTNPLGKLAMSTNPLAMLIDPLGKSIHPSDKPSKTPPVIAVVPIPSEYETEVQRRVQAEIEKIMAQSEGCIEQCMTQSKAQAQARAQAQANQKKKG